MTFSFRQIRYFLAAASCGQLSQAANELNVSQSAITTAIKLLESELETKLFVRSSTGVLLTPEGENFLRHARDILASVEAGLQSTRHALHAESGVVRVGMTSSIAGYFMIPILSRFHRVYPEIEVILEEGSRDSISSSVANGSLDLGILLMPKKAPNEAVTATVLHPWPRRLWLPSNHPLLTVEKIDLSDVAKLPYIALTLDDAWNHALRYWELMPSRPEPIYKTDSIEAVRNMIGAGMGVTILSDMLYRRWSLEGHRVELRDLETKIPPLDIGYIISKNRETPAAARVFTAYLQRASSSPTYRST